MCSMILLVWYFMESYIRRIPNNYIKSSLFSEHFGKIQLPKYIRFGSHLLSFFIPFKLRSRSSVPQLRHDHFIAQGRDILQNLIFLFSIVTSE